MHHGMPQGGPRGLGRQLPQPRRDAQSGQPPRFRPRGAGGAAPSFDPDDFPDDERDEAADPNAIDASEIKGVDVARGKLIPWFRKIVDSVEEEQTHLQVDLEQVTSQGGSLNVATVPHILDETAVEDTVDQLLGIAADDLSNAQFTGAQISYAMVVTLQTAKPVRFTFVLKQPQLPSARNAPPARQHFADPNGVIGMLMQQNLQFAHIAIDNSTVGKDDLKGIIRELREEIRYLKRNQAHLDEQKQLLMDANLQREFMVNEHHAKVERDGKIAKTFEVLAPQILALALPPHMRESVLAIAGMGKMAAAQVAAAGEGQGGAESGDPEVVEGDDADIVDQLIAELERDQELAMKLVTIIGEKPRCAALFGTLYQSAQNRAKARAAGTSP